MKVRPAARRDESFILATINIILRYADGFIKGRIPSSTRTSARAVSISVQNVIG